MISGSGQTFDQFAPIDLARSDLERYDVILLIVNFQLLLMPFNAQDVTTGSCRTWASFSSFIGIPIVLVIFVVDESARRGTAKREYRWAWRLERLNSVTLLDARCSQESRWMIVTCRDISWLLRLWGSAQPPAGADASVVADVCIVHCKKIYQLRWSVSSSRSSQS